MFIVECYNLLVNLSDLDYIVIVEVFGKKVGVGVFRCGEFFCFEVEE